MGDHRCENCGRMFYTRYVQDIGKCFCPECRVKIGTAKKEKEYGEAKEYWEARASLHWWALYPTPTSRSDAGQSETRDL